MSAITSYHQQSSGEVYISSLRGLDASQTAYRQSNPSPAVKPLRRRTPTGSRNLLNWIPIEVAGLGLRCLGTISCRKRSEEFWFPVPSVSPAQVHTSVSDATIHIAGLGPCSKSMVPTYRCICINTYIISGVIGIKSMYIHTNIHQLYLLGCL